MSKKTTYTQCRLRREAESGHMETVSWIPSKFGKIGQIVDLKEDDGNWSRGWEIVLVGPTIENPPDWRKLIRGHRKMTGDSTPRQPGA